MNPYIGHPTQLSGVEEMQLVGGKGNGMRLVQVRNGKGLELTVSADRCADLSRVYFKGDNCGFFSPCGYVAPTYYDCVGAGFLKSFTAGFLTTCGLTNLGGAGTDAGVTLPLHGTIANQPCESISWTETEDCIEIHAVVNDSAIFSRKLVLNRTIAVSKLDNILQITDTVENQGDTVSPLMMMYHMNMGFPLLSENAQISIASNQVVPATAHAADGLAQWDKVEKPTPHFQEQCYFHTFDKNASASIYNPDIQKGLEISFDATKLVSLVEWKMFGIRDYVLGLEPRNCMGGSRAQLREKNHLPMLEPGQSQTYQVRVRFFEAKQSG